LIQPALQCHQRIHQRFTPKGTVNQPGRARSPSPTSQSSSSVAVLIEGLEPWRAIRQHVEMKRAVALSPPSGPSPGGIVWRNLVGKGEAFARASIAQAQRRLPVAATAAGRSSSRHRRPPAIGPVWCPAIEKGTQQGSCDLVQSVCGTETPQPAQ
jgi:hypothetical protein